MSTVIRKNWYMYIYIFEKYQASIISSHSCPYVTIHYDFSEVTFPIIKIMKEIRISWVD